MARLTATLLAAWLLRRTTLHVKEIAGRRLGGVRGILVQSRLEISDRGLKLTHPSPKNLDFATLTFEHNQERRLSRWGNRVPKLLRNRCPRHLIHAEHANRFKRLKTDQSVNGYNEVSLIIYLLLFGIMEIFVAAQPAVDRLPQQRRQRVRCIVPCANINAFAASYARNRRSVEWQSR
jgi:hypothetical protein